MDPSGGSFNGEEESTGERESGSPEWETRLFNYAILEFYAFLS
jgi:hypothetical protein